MLPPETDRYELALRASNEGIWKWSVGDERVDYSDRVLGFLGYEVDEAPNIFQDYEECFHENDREYFKQVLEGVMRKDGKELFGVDSRFVRGDGKVCWLRIRGACIRDEAGGVLMLAGSMMDISQRKQAELELEEERHLLRMLIENIPNNVYFKDKDSKFVMVNQATADKMGFASGADLIGHSDHDYFKVEHADKSREDEVEIMMTRASQLQTLERETWKGRDDSWVITTKIPWYDRKGEVRGTFGVSSDVSPLVNTQKRLVEVAEQLRLRNESYREELQLAREIQAAVLESDIDSVRAVDSGGYDVDFATKHVPAGEMAGDFYEVIPISKNKVGLLICDVMGHGVRAALVVSVLRGLIEREQLSASSPEWLLYGLNDGLYKILHRAGITMFATALYVVIDAEGGKVSYATAGHALPILMKDGRCDILSDEGLMKGPALGLMPESPYGCGVIGMEDFDTMLLYTDGIYEAENSDGEEFGVEGVCALLESFDDGIELQGLVDKMTDGVEGYCDGGSFADDVCVLGVRVGK